MTTKTMKTKHAHNKTKITLIIILSVLVILALAVMLLINTYISGVQPVGDDSTQQAFVVEDGSTVNNVIEQLYDQKLIRNETMAKVYARLNKVNNLYAGNYLLNESMSTKDIFDTLTDESKAIIEQVEVTLVPGKWCKDYAQAIADATNLSAQDILDSWNNIDYLYQLIDKYEFLTTEAFSSEHVYLEGYIMPNTYYFYSNTTVEQVTEKLLDQTNAIYQQYKGQLETLMAAKDLTIHQVFTLASVVMFEANTEENMKLVAGVFYNRLKAGMKLQSSVTVCYALYDDYHVWQDCETHPDIDSKYNTYKYEGLPVGPVCNFTTTALEAVITPTDSDYFYFMASTVSGKMYYAKTYAEHEKNVKKYLYK